MVITHKKKQTKNKKKKTNTFIYFLNVSNSTSVYSQKEWIDKDLVIKYKTVKYSLYVSLGMNFLSATFHN